MVAFSVFLCSVYDLYFPYHGLHFSFSKLDLLLEMISCFNKLFQTEKKKKARRGRSCGLPGVPRVGPHGDGNNCSLSCVQHGTEEAVLKASPHFIFVVCLFNLFILFGG